MKDKCIDKYDRMWDDHKSRESDSYGDDGSKWITLKSILLSNIRYIKQRYGSLDAFRKTLDEKVSFLEDGIQEMNDSEFIICGPAIGSARKYVKESGAKFGAGFQREPSATERASISGLQPVKLRKHISSNGKSVVEEEYDNHGPTDDIFDSDLDND